MKITWKQLKFEHGIELTIKGNRWGVDEYDVHRELCEIASKYEGVIVKKNVKVLLENIANHRGTTTGNREGRK